MLAVDDRGIGLRATWRLEHGFVNLSIWRDDVCVETFHLTPRDASRFVAFFVDGLADVAAVPPVAPVFTLPSVTQRRPARHRLAEALRRLARVIDA